MPINNKPTPEQQADRPIPPLQTCNHCWHLIREYSTGNGTNMVHLCCFCGIEKVTFIPQTPQFWSIAQQEHGPYMESRWYT
jgi:hypothetical protein